MKASDLVRQLKEITDVYGDVPVVLRVKKHNRFEDTSEWINAECSVRTVNIGTRSHVAAARIEPEE